MFYFILTLLLFGSMEVVSKPLMNHVGAVEITLYRFVLCFFMLFLLFVFTNKIKELRNIPPKMWLFIAALGITNTFISMSLLQLAIKHAPVSETVIIFSANPLFVMLFSALFHLEKFSYYKLIALAIGLVGMIIVVSPHSFVLTSGTLYALGAALSFALYTIGSKRAMKNITPLVFNTISIFFGLIALTIFIALSGDRIIPPAYLWQNSGALLAMLYLGILVSGVGYISFMTAIKQLGATTASFIFILKPAVAMVLAIIFLSEQLSLSLIAGMILVISGLAIILWEKKRKGI